MDMQKLVTIILGSDLEKYDGRIIEESYLDSHMHSINRIANTLKKEGFDIGFFDKSVAEEAAYDLIKKGHIIIFNICNQLVFLKLPITISKKQFESLKLFEEYFKNIALFEQSIDPINEEQIISKEYVKNYQINKQKYVIK